MDISFTSNYKSISPFDWNNIADLSIITGLNGAGKSQLLQVINDQYNQAVNNRSNNNQNTLPIFGNHDLRFEKISHGAHSFGNLHDSGNSVSYSDLKLIVDTIYKKKHPEPQNNNYDYQQEQQLRELMQERV